MIKSSSRGLFISYRRCDAGPYARLLKVQLGRSLPGTPVFMDLDSIEPGIDFAEAIKAGLDSCPVMIALIGSKWLELCDEEGHRRIDNPDDFVRFEIRTALERCMRVIPVLIDGANMPKYYQLPDDLGGLARLNALQMSYDRYEYDESRLISILRRMLTTGKPAAAARSRQYFYSGRALSAGTVPRPLRMRPPDYGGSEQTGAHMPETPEPEHLSGRHRDTLRQIFDHPTSHNIEWHAVVSLLGEVGTVTVSHDGKVDVTVGAEKAFLDPPKGKDIDEQMVVDLRRMLAAAGYQAP